MCLMSAFEPGVLPNVTDLVTGCSVNGDGSGFALEIPEGGILTFHGLDSETVIAEFARRREQYPQGNALFHSRWITAGAPGLGNCQPFQVDAQTVLAHNGTIPELDKRSRGDKAGRSDSRIFVEESMLPRNLHHRKVRRALETYLGDSSMVVIRAGQLYIFNEGHGVRKDGVWHSNSDFVPAGEAVDHAWATELGHFDARLAYRKYGQKMLADLPAEKRELFSQRRAELLAAHPQIMTGTLR